MPVNRGPYSKTGTAGENTGRITMKWMIWEVKLYFLCLKQTNLPANCFFHTLFSIRSNLQDITVVVFRESALVLHTGGIPTDVDVLPTQHGESQVHNIRKILNKQLSPHTLSLEWKWMSKLMNRKVTYSRTPSVNGGCRFSKGKRVTNAAPIFIRTSATSAKLGTHTLNCWLPLFTKERERKKKLLACLKIWEEIPDGWVVAVHWPIW